MVVSSLWLKGSWHTIMDSYLIPIQSALFTFPIAAAILTVPFLIIQYRKYGYVNKLRSFVLFSFLLYCISAYYLVMLPLPRDTSNCVREGSLMTYMQLQPFTFVDDILRETGFNWRVPETYLQMFKHQSFLQVLFNLLLTFPLGVYLRYYFRRTFWQTFTLAACMSLFFELTQLSGLYGIYDCPYRLFDVDDLMTNTLGGMLGFGLAPLFTYFLPRSEELDKNVELEHMTVGYIRRAIAYTIDVGCMTFLTPIILPIQAGVVHFSTNIGIDLTGWDRLVQTLAALALILFVYMIVIPSFTGGRTLGKMVTRIHVIEDKRRGQQREITFFGLLKRYGLLYYVGLGSYTFALIMGLYMDLPRSVRLIALGISFLILGAFAIHVLLRLFSRDKLLYYERLSGTRNVISLKKPAGNETEVVPSSEDEKMPEQIQSLSHVSQESRSEVLSTPIEEVQTNAVEEVDSKAMREMLELRQALLERKIDDYPSKRTAYEADQAKAEVRSEPEQLLPRSVDSEQMSAGSPPLSDAVERELERLRAKIKQNQNKE